MNYAAKCVVSVLLILSITGCENSNIPLVQNGYLKWNKTTTVGNALNALSQCEHKGWTERILKNGINVVTFKCTEDTTKYFDDLKSAASWRLNEVGALDVYKIVTLYNFAISSDNSFHLNSISTHTWWANGVHLDTVSRDHDELRSAMTNVYNNDAGYPDISGPGKATKAMYVAIAVRRLYVPEYVKMFGADGVSLNKVPNINMNKIGFGYKVLQKPVIKHAFKKLLGKQYELVLTSMRGELHFDGRYYYASGCARHLCTIFESAFAIDKNTGRIYALLLTNGHSLRMYGATDSDDLPAPLKLEWDRLQKDVE